MTTVSIDVPVAREDIFAVLADGWSYVSWVVGASHIRDVDHGWPATGTRIHHSVGLWPLLGQDVTEVLAVDPPRMVEMEARLWPLGAARIRLELDETRSGTTRVRMIERADRGLGRLIPEAVQKLLLVPRNREALHRLRDLAVGKTSS
jgi:hypothetical protein